MRDAVALDASDPVTDYWITVGGGVEPGETFEAAVVREIFEETGHVIDDPDPCIYWQHHAVRVIFQIWHLRPCVLTCRRARTS